MDKKEFNQIELHNISKTFIVGKGRHNIEALIDISLSITEGEFVVIYGPSGCGKSTLLNTIIGFEKPTRGRVLIDGEDLYKLSEDIRSEYRSHKFGVVYQTQNWVKSLNSRENVALPLIAQSFSYNDAVEDAERFIHKMNLQEFLKQMPTQLSGGEQQKLGLARALISKPKIVLGDEPTGNLDSVSSDIVIGFLKELNTHYKRTVIIITHNHDYWNIGHRQIEMKDGKIIKDSKNSG